LCRCATVALLRRELMGKVPYKVRVGGKLVDRADRPGAS
jgi:hypothetical protein